MQGEYLTRTLSREELLMLGSFDPKFPRETGEALEEALAAHPHSRKDQVSAGEHQRMIALIEQAQQEGR